jgi:hypothetical protein
MNSEDRAMVEALWRHSRRGALDGFLAQGDGCGWCRQPVRLRGYAATAIDGERSHVFSSAAQPDGVVLKACGSRSELRCPACAAVYRGDARHLVRAGLEGGKGVDEAVATHPAVFITLTAPSFGAVHGLRVGGPCRPSPKAANRCRHGCLLGCPSRHHASDPVLGTPLCPDCFDYEGAVLHNASTPELWRRTTIYVQRHLAGVLGCTQSDVRRTVRLASCRVAEFQRRGLVHLHAVIRADAPDGARPPVEGWQLARACAQAARTVSAPHARGVAHWGDEIDVSVLETGDDRAQRVASYVAKYSTKSSAETAGLEHRIRSLDDLARRALSPHLHRLAATAWMLGEESELEDFGLQRHAHRLGYGGHFLTKSRTYSTTFGALREARMQWRERQRNGTTASTGTTTTTEGRWRAVGRGWANRGEELFAGYQQRQRAEERREAEFEWYTRRA